MWRSTHRLKAGRRGEYRSLVVRFPSAMASELLDLVGRPAVAYRDGSRIVIEVSA